MNQTHLDVTIVIGTFNRADMLKDGLLSLDKLNRTGDITYEVIVVDNDSTDHTSQMVKDTQSEVGYPLRLFVETQKGVASARNLGIKEAQGEWVAFFDDDQLADENWLVELLAMAQEKQCEAVGGDVKLLMLEPTDRQLDKTCRRLLGEMYGLTEPCEFNRVLVPGTNNLMIRKSVFERIGIFDTELVDGGEDADLYRRMREGGVVTWFAPKAIIHHMIPPYRMEDQYMMWTSLRQGNHVAYREYKDWGFFLLPVMTAARVARAAVKFVPPYLLAKLKGDRETALGHRCWIWFTEGYVRRAISLLSPFKQNSFFSKINFREGRQKLAKQN
ncbi:MAG: glycosyltransferase family 2 protein [Planctomycetales bacterium]|nr:glycosyltransferase family 2 protein [Planctomycetales bacterium]